MGVVTTTSRVVAVGSVWVVGEAVPPEDRPQDVAVTRASATATAPSDTASPGRRARRLRSVGEVRT